MYVIGLIVVILMVSAGLGFVIFVHELGHFLVAKACGVKCEKFYLGFDIGGLKLCKFQWGETEYGIGILPLGGYVKMLGQEDNPAKLAEEIERAKQSEGREESGEGRGPDSSLPSEPSQSSINNPQSTINNPSYDPRSFLAKSVPQRMAIISAGVIMNVIFAFFMAVVAFWLGVEQPPCVIGVVSPGDPAWQADLRPGDEILQIAGKEMSQFRDLMTTIQVGDIPKEGVPLLVRRAGQTEPLRVVVNPDRSRGKFLIGVGPGVTTHLLEERKTWLPQQWPVVIPGSAADRAKPSFENGDKIVRIDDVPTGSYAAINQQLARKAERRIAVTIERAAAGRDGTPTEQTRQIAIAVDAAPMRTLGLEMEMGPISAVQVGSPAAAAGILAGDLIESIDGSPPGDPMTLPDRLRRRARQKVEITVLRGESKTPQQFIIEVREPLQFSPPMIAVAVDALGIAYHVHGRVRGVAEGSPAAEAGLATGDLILDATINPPDKETLRKLQFDQPKRTISFRETKHNWPLLVSELQDVAPGSTVDIAYSRDGKEQTAKELEPVEARDSFNPDRGLLFDPMTFECRASGVGEALALGGRETIDNLMLVYRSVKALSTNRVSAGEMGGPVMIIRAAAAYADRGHAALLIFLTMLSANLAVLNILPIPVLDGGHLAFLLYEGICGKPANERVQVVLTYIGLGLILALMVWVMGLDFGLIPRR